MAMERERSFRHVLNDAYYTGRVLSVLGIGLHGVYVSVDYYGLPDEKDKEFYLYSPEYTKFVSREFGSRERVMKDKNTMDMACFRCWRMLRKKIRRFPYGQRPYFCLVHCPERGYVKGEIRIKKSEKDRYYIVKIAKVVGDEDMELLTQRKEDGRRERSIRSHTRKYDNN